MNTKTIPGIIASACLLICCAASAQKTKLPSTHHPVSKPSGLAMEDKLRIRLQFHPHDAVAHKQLIKLLQEKNAFRAIVAEDTTWLNNNRNDALIALIEIASYSENALHDPEYAITQLRLHLTSISRDDDPEDFDNWSDELAAKLMKRGRPEEALPLLKELVRLNPNEAGSWADYGDVLSVLGEKVEAEKAFRHAITLDPSMEGFHQALAEALVRAGDLNGAESEYLAALSIYDAQYKSGEPTDSYHSFIRSMVKIEAAYGEEHDLAEKRLKLAHILLLENKYNDAIVHTKAALDADHNEFAAFYLLAQIYDAKGDHDQANTTRENAQAIIQKQAVNEGLNRKKPDIDPRVLFLSDTLWNQDSGYPAFPSEIKAILESRAAALSSFERVELALAYFALGRGSDGKEQWERAIVSDPTIDNAASHAHLADELLKAGARNDALPHLRRAYELDPQNTTFRMDYDTLRKQLATASGTVP